MTSIHIRRSLRQKIFLRFTTLVGLALIATGTLSVETTQSLLWQKATEDLLFLSLEQSQSIEALLEKNRSIVRLLAADREIPPLIQGHASAGTIRTHILQKKELAPGMEDITVASTEGIILASTDGRLEGENLSTFDHFRHGTNGTHIGPLDLLDTRRTYVITGPLRYEDGELAGVLLVEFSSGEIYDIFSQARIGDRTTNYLLLEPREHGTQCINPRYSVLSAKGLVASRVEEELEPKQVHQKAVSQLCEWAAAHPQGILRAKDEEGRMVVAAYHELHETGLGIVASMQEREIFAPMQLLLAILIGTTCILLLLVTLIAFRLSREIVLPIWKLRESLQRLNTGSFTHEQGVFTGDELEVLDGEIGHLAVRLHEAYTSLEQRVRERTRELHATHAKDEALIESIGEGFLAIDLQGTVLAANRATELLFQWNRSDIIGKHFESFLHLHSRDDKPIAPSEHTIERALREKTTIRTLPSDVLLCERRDGTSFPLSITATPFLLGMEMQGIVVTLRDITEEKRIDRMKSEFISLASHQLRTPLTAIGWYIELLQGVQENLSPDQREYIGQILGSHHRMVELVNSLLNVSRIELGRVKIEPKEITIDEIIRVPIENLTPQITQRKLHLTERIPTISVSVDPDLVRMVLENILSNAVKYTPEGGTIELSVIADKNELRFAVQDTGLGIPTAQQERVFEKLFRADNVMKTDTEGTGIGLYIAKNTAEAWGGRVWFESTENRGTRFFFTVPRNMQKVSSENGDAKPTGGRAAGSSSRRSQ